MPVAKTYMQCAILSEPFVKNGKEYVTIETPFGGQKQVRWYDQYTWNKMYPELAKTEKPNYRQALGFGDAGYITVYLGDTYANLDWFKSKPECRYSKTFGWYTVSAEPLPLDIPDGVRTENVLWDFVSKDDETIDESMAEKCMNYLKYGESTSEYVGEIGDRSEFDLTVDKAIPLEGYYGTSLMHIMHDANGNTFVWTTAAKQLSPQTTYHLKGTIKDHKEYKGVKQTVLTRCSILK